IGIIVGIVPGIIIAKQLRKNLVSNTIVFSEADKYKGLFYGAIIGNTVMVIVFVIIILSLESDSFSFDKVLESIIRVGTRLTSMVMGAVFIILIIQYIWISQYKTKKDP
ncbi:MAG: hypothetical protein HY265_03100, partial [Deltaproteobacteria bacterium]|nr:hypothetical protein [Deltaproteobacteria bacterium]